MSFKIVLTDAEGVARTVSGKSPMAALYWTCRAVEEASMGESDYATGWAEALRKILEPGSGGVKALNRWIRELHEYAALMELQQGDVDTSDWNDVQFERYLADRPPPLKARVKEGSE